MIDNPTGLVALDLILAAQAKNENPRNLIDHARIAAAQVQVDDATTKLTNAKAAVEAATADVARCWDESVRQIAAGGDALAGHTAHGEAVQRRNFATQMLDEFERNLAETREHFRLEKIAAHEPVLKKARELKMIAARAKDDATKIAEAADGLAKTANHLIATAHTEGLKHFPLNTVPRGAVTTKEERFFWENEDAAARAFWGKEVSI